MSSSSKLTCSISESITFSVLLRSPVKVLPSAKVAAPIDVAELLTVLSSRSALPTFAPTTDKFSLLELPEPPISSSVALRSPTLLTAGSRSLLLLPIVETIIAATIGIPIIKGNHHHHPLSSLAVSPSSTSSAIELLSTSAIIVGWASSSI